MDLGVLRARVVAVLAELCDGCAAPADVAARLRAAGARGRRLYPCCPISDFVAMKVEGDFLVEVQGVGDHPASVRLFTRRKSGEAARPHLVEVELPEVGRLFARKFDDGQYSDLVRSDQPGRPRKRGT